MVRCALPTRGGESGGARGRRRHTTAPTHVFDAQTDAPGRWSPRNRASRRRAGPPRCRRGSSFVSVTARTLSLRRTRKAGAPASRLHTPSRSTPLDTGGAIAFAARQAGVGDETFIAMNADVLAEIDVTSLVQFHRDRGAEATIALTPVDDPSLFGVVAVDANGLVGAFIEKPSAQEAPSNMINAGIYVLEPSFLARIPEGRRTSVEREVFPALAREGALFALGSDALWTDMGTPGKYLEANLAWARREGAIGGTIAGTHPGAEVVNSVLHPDVRVEKGAIVRGAVVLEGGQRPGWRLCEPFGPGSQRGGRAGGSSMRSRSWAMAGSWPTVLSSPGPGFLSRFEPPTLSFVGRHSSCGDQVQDEPGPPSLVRGPQPSACVPVEVLVEPNGISPRRILLKERVVAVDRTAPVWTGQEQRH